MNITPKRLLTTVAALAVMSSTSCAAGATSPAGRTTSIGSISTAAPAPLPEKRTPPPPSAGRSTPPVPSAVPEVEDGGSRVRSYTSIAELASQSVAVVVARGVDGVKTEKTSGADFPVVTFVVDQVLSGSILKGSKIEVRMFAIAKATGQPLGSDGTTVMLFLRPFVVAAGTSTGEWVTTDPVAGIYLRLTDGNFHKVDPDSAELPPAVDLASLKLPEPKNADDAVRNPLDYGRR